MITININDDSELISPELMLDTEYGTVFQQYFHGKPEKDYYVSLGLSKKVIHIWYNKEKNNYELIIDDRNTLKLGGAIKVKKIDANINFQLLMSN